jgi:hypothetical protein
MSFWNFFKSNYVFFSGCLGFLWTCQDNRDISDQSLKGLIFFSFLKTRYQCLIKNNWYDPEHKAGK